MQSITKRLLVSVLCLLLSGCMNLPLAARSVRPNLPLPVVSEMPTHAVPLLHCISNMMTGIPHNDNRNVKTEYLVRVGDIQTKMPTQIGDIILPKDMRETVFNSMAKIEHGFTVIDPGQPQIIAGVAGVEIIYPDAEAAVRPDLVLQGALDMVQPLAKGTATTTFFAGTDAMVETFSARLQLRAVNAKTGTIQGPPVTLTVRMFGGTQGVSFFVLTGSNYARGEQVFRVNAEISYALQLLSDHVVANILMNLGTSLWGIGFENCRDMVPDANRSSPPDDPPRNAGLPASQQVQMVLGRIDNRYCVDFYPPSGFPANGSYLARILQYGHQREKITEKTILVPPGAKGICINATEISRQSAGLEVRYEARSGVVYGNASLRL